MTPETTRRPVRGVLFDIGDTVIHIHPSVGEIYASVCREKGESRDPGELQRSFRSVWEKYSRLVPSGVNRFAHFPGGESEWWRHLVKEVLAAVGIEERAPAWYDDFAGAFRRPGAWRTYPEVEETLRRLRERDLVVGAVSNWDRHLPAILDLAGLGGTFRPLVISAVENIEKPEGKLFRIALERAGLAADETLFVGNRPVEDYRGAEAAGLRALLIARNGVEPPGGMKAIGNLLEIFDHMP